MPRTSADALAGVRAATRQLPEERWNERYGWKAAAVLSALAVSIFAFTYLVERLVADEGLTRWDARFNQWLNDEAWGPLLGFFEVVTIAGYTVFLLAVTLAAAALLASRGDRADAALVLLAFSGSVVANLIVKLTLERPRPAFHDADLTFSTFSFPSAHASVSVAVYGAFTLIVLREVRRGLHRVLILLGLVVLLSLIGFSRIYLGAHYFSDVLAGFSLGTAWLMLCVLALTAWESRRHQSRA